MLETNVLIIGKTGVGKSALINYVYGEEIREKGAGKPVTQKGLHKEIHQMETLTVNLYDSWGLEANEAEEWQNIILEEVGKHDRSYEIKDWFHTIFYCFSIQSARVEDFETKEIIKPLMDRGNHVVIILTHADVPGAEQKKAAMVAVLRQELKILAENIICVASEKKTLLGGQPREPFGKEGVILKIQENLWTNIQAKLPLIYDRMIREEITAWKNRSHYLVDRRLKFYNRNVIVKELALQMNTDLSLSFVEIEKATLLHMKNAYDYYSRLVETLYNNQVQVHFNSEDAFVKKKLTYQRNFDDRAADWFTSVVFTFIPIFGLFAQKERVDYARIRFKTEINKTYSDILEEVPHMVEMFKKDIVKNTEQIILSEEL